jgi:release factor glutamine methyltransferase
MTSSTHCVTPMPTMATAELTSLSTWLRYATERLEAAGVASPRHDAERLAAHALGMRWSDLWSRSSGPLTRLDLDRLDGVLRRREHGEPLGYIERSVVFHALELVCGPGALVPRPETEVLVDVALELVANTSSPRIADIGCGTGAVGLAIGAARADAELWLTDVSEQALIYARTNAYMWHANASIVRGDLFGALPDELRGTFDLIASNPPYVRTGTELPPDVRAEPGVALFVGDDGLDVIGRILDEAPDWLGPGGAIAVEIGDAEQAEAVCARLRTATVRHDLNGRPRVVWARI